MASQLSNYIRITATGLILLFFTSNTLWARHPVDKNIIEAYKNKNNTASLILFFQYRNQIPHFIKTMKKFNQVTILPLNFMPAAILTGNDDPIILNAVLENPLIVHIALNEPAGEKSESRYKNEKSITQYRYPGIDKWWAKNFKGQSATVGIIDSGIDKNHPALINKNILINKTKNSFYTNYKDGIRTPHGTGVACIYSGYPIETDLKNIRGVAYKAPVILSTLAGEGYQFKENFWLTYAGLNWFFVQNKKPNVINYSFGNGSVNCSSCPDWSGMSMIIDYIVNQYKILWVTSAGNNGFVKPRPKAPFSSSMTIPADNYNALTVANMNIYHKLNVHSNDSSEYRQAISYSSSRGPTLSGRKKPDITAPGNDTYTCAPQKKYHFKYSKSMNYRKGYRYMGGTSSAAPHVGGAILLVKEAGITNPIAIKALLINSADTWTDSNLPGPEDPDYLYRGGHHRIIGSQWNPTYGWGYINMNKAFEQRFNIKMNYLSQNRKIIDYVMTVKPQDKITVVHERRVGFHKDQSLWKLSYITLDLIDPLSKKSLVSDRSPIDNVHQVSLCSIITHKECKQNTTKKVIVRIRLQSVIEGENKEPFALAYS